MAGNLRKNIEKQVFLPNCPPPKGYAQKVKKKHLFFNVFKTEAISEQNDKIITFSMIKKYKLKLNKINIHNEKVHKNDSSHGFKTQAKTEKI